MKLQVAAENVDQAVKYVYEGPFISCGPCEDHERIRSDLQVLKGRLETLDTMIEKLEEALDTMEYMP